MPSIKSVNCKGYKFRICNIEPGMIYPDLSDEKTLDASKKEETEFLHAYSNLLSQSYTIYGEMNKKEDRETREEFMKAQKKTEVRKSTTGDPGWVYLIFAKNGMYKIGKTKSHPSKRYKQICHNIPLETELTASIKTHYMSRDEKFLHDLFKDKRKKGEWFALSQEDAIFIAEGEWAWKSPQ